MWLGKARVAAAQAAEVALSKPALWWVAHERSYIPSSVKGNSAIVTFNYSDHVDVRVQVVGKTVEGWIEWACPQTIVREKWNALQTVYFSAEEGQAENTRLLQILEMNISDDGLELDTIMALLRQASRVSVRRIQIVQNFHEWEPRKVWFRGSRFQGMSVEADLVLSLKPSDVQHWRDDIFMVDIRSITDFVFGEGLINLRTRAEWEEAEPWFIWRTDLSIALLNRTALRWDFFFQILPEGRSPEEPDQAHQAGALIVYLPPGTILR